VEGAAELSIGWMEASPSSSLLSSQGWSLACCVIFASPPHFGCCGTNQLLPSCHDAVNTSTPELLEFSLVSCNEH
jgi:hypothetical protein